MAECTLIARSGMSKQYEFMNISLDEDSLDNHQIEPCVILVTDKFRRYKSINKVSNLYKERLALQSKLENGDTVFLNVGDDSIDEIYTYFDGCSVLNFS